MTTALRQRNPTDQVPEAMALLVTVEFDILVEMLKTAETAEAWLIRVALNRLTCDGSGVRITDGRVDGLCPACEGLGCRS